MEKFIKKIWLGCGIGLFICGALSVNITSAQTQNTTQQCSPSVALSNWDDFLGATISVDGFENYWKEALGLYNKCQLNDIDALQSQIDNLQKQIRTSFYSCNNSRIEELRPQYFKLNAELYYVRNFIETSDGNFVKANESKLLENMISEFAKTTRQIDEGTLRKYFEEFKKKYADREKSYASCKNNKWAEVSKKWKELENNLKALESSANQISKKSNSTAANSNQSANTAKNAPKNKGGSFLSKVLSATINKQDPSKSLDKIATDFQQQNPSIGTPNLDQLTSNFSSSQKSYATSLSKQQMLDRYQVLYKQSGDDAFTDLTKKMNVMNEVIKQSLPTLSKLGTCSKQIGARQCK